MKTKEIEIKNIQETVMKFGKKTITVKITTTDNQEYSLSIPERNGVLERMYKDLGDYYLVKNTKYKK